MSVPVCKKCGSLSVSVEINPEGHMHYARQNCKDCNGFVWLPKPENIDKHKRSNNADYKALHRQRDGSFICCWCGCDETIYDSNIGFNFQLDHIKELRDGGEDTFENTQILCFDCHSHKTSRRKHIKLIAERLKFERGNKYV